MNKVTLLCLFLLFNIAFSIHLDFYHDKITSELKETIEKFEENSENISVLIKLKEQINYDNIEETDLELRGIRIVEELQNIASTTQKDILKWLNQHEHVIEIHPFWVVNAIRIDLRIPAVVNELLEGFESLIELVEPNNKFVAQLEHPNDVNNAPYKHLDVEKRDAMTTEWNVDRIGAPLFWDKGITGAGYVVANADTGVQWDHPALINNYRGYDSVTGTVTHDYNWWDGSNTSSSNPICGGKTKAPCDDNGHGTHTTGTSVGYDGATNHIGVAFGAKWIACKNMDMGVGSPASYISCLQFLVAPTDLNGNNPDPSLRPHVISNSYGCPPSEGCAADSLKDAVTSVVEAGIVMSVSAGNDGSTCGSVNAPPGIYSNIISVGALQRQSSLIASYSSRGPVLVDGSNRIKPDIVCGGSSVRSSYPTNTYKTLSGTSMAAPAIAGSVPLLYEADPSIARNVLITTYRLLAGSIERNSTQCGSEVLDENFSMNNSINDLHSLDSYIAQATDKTKNDVYGWGEADIVASANTN
eukprot:TRINITY_DN364_c0_g3_i1.p1 TRINITY_DN364_c0_g3~~TRINITY_DN364_c0_g3_i1.p1  ORF type:complete len:539 (-),score=188.33 TRINITY_DN364_c0_g3_i1:84-1667(-)